MSGQHTKSRDTLDYKIRFHHGPYLYIDPVKKNVTSYKEATEPVIQIIDDIPSENDQQQQYESSQKTTLKVEDMDQDRIVLNKYEQMQREMDQIVVTNDQEVEIAVINNDDQDKISQKDGEERDDAEGSNNKDNIQNNNEDL